MEILNYSSLRLLGPDNKKEKSQPDLNEELIIETFPTLKWNKKKRKLIDKFFWFKEFDVDDLVDKLSKKYKNYKIYKRSHKYSNREIYNIVIDGIGGDDINLKVYVSCYNDDIADLIRTFNKFEDGNLNVIKFYKGLYHAKFIELGAKLYRNSRILKELNNSKSILYKFNYKKKNIEVSLEKTSQYLKVIFGDDWFSDINCSLIIKNLNSFPLSEQLKLIDVLEENLNLRLYEDYKDTLDILNHDIEIKQPNYISNKVFVNPKKRNAKKDKVYDLLLLNSITMNYLRSSGSIEYWPFKFLTYYHILEYYFEICFTNYFKNLIRKKGEDPLNILSKLNKYNRSEEKKLYLVLKKFISLKAFKKHFKLKENVPKIEISKSVELEEIILNKEENFYISLSSRIYKLRNSIVHSKSQNNKKALIYSNKDRILFRKLVNETSMIKWIAEEINKKTSKNFS